MSTKLDQIMEKAKSNPKLRFTSLAHLLKMMLKATGKKGVPQGCVITPLTQKVISNSRG